MKIVKQVVAVSVWSTVLAGCSTPSQVYWDHKVKELCEKDGGVTVYEKVELTREEYERNDGKNGGIRVPSEKSPLAGKYDFSSKTINSDINASNPHVWRTEGVIYRKSDGKELGKMVTYSRRGGDISTGIAESSHFGCGDIKTIKLDVENQIFTVEGEEK